MKNPIRHLVGITLLFWMLCPIEGHAQLGFCEGNSGDSIFTEDFGAGTTNGPPLPAGTTSYTYIDGEPIDGKYTISSYTAYYDWFNTTDHTPNDSNGKAFIVNASYTPGEFYQRTVTGLCENTSYEFSSWLINLHPSSGGCNGNGIPINVRFQIWDNTGTDLLASGDTGDIYDKSSPVWEQYALVFQTLPGQTSVILKMLNNGAGGCGNDLAIDDIVFKTCGDFVDITNDQNESNILVCEDYGPVTTHLTAHPDYSIYSTHVYQWQESTDGENWNNIVGETNQDYTPPTITSSIFYRVKMAEDLVNLNNSLCNTQSEVFDIIIVPKPDPPLSDYGTISLCPDQGEVILVTVPSNTTVNWYDVPSGGMPLLENNSTFSPQIAGTYYAEAVSTMVECTSNTRTAITVDFYTPPMPIDEDLTFCEGSSIVLSAGINNMQYAWNTGATTSEIEVDTPGQYTVNITDTNGCSAIKTINLVQLDSPVIDYISSDDYTLEIHMANSGNFAYSLDGISYQRETVFENTPGGQYTIYVSERNGCGTTPMEYIHLVIPKFFTPNGDFVNDVFIPEGVEAFSNYEVMIFNRYGMLIKHTQNTPFEWDGRFNNIALPSDDYWYSITIDGKTIKGHFSLKR
ncbi:T9SS type B sorting domain-containing protein [Maribacter luteus]|uniref:T9SS type B sorting domain-containing protein n=1 Tax=Maribacter luteus TaxID=2594478 RepID=UPI002493461F|nr:T9SS type B sorting domain-containing protein [Maribacter luteus]